MKETAAASREQERYPSVRMDVADTELVAPENQRVVEEGSVSLRDGLERGDEIGNLCRVPGVDFDEPGRSCRIALVRQLVVSRVQPEPTHHDVAARRCGDETRHARDVARECPDDQIEL